jgi:hypothetical protein
MYAITPAMRLGSITKTPLRDLGCVKTAALCFHHHLTAELVWQNNLYIS